MRVAGVLAARVCVLLVVTSALAGCGHRELAQGGQVAIAEPHSLPSPTQADLLDGTRPQLIGPGDVIAVDVFGLPELSRQVRVDSSGRVSVPLAGTIDVNGMDGQRVAQAIETRLRAAYVRDPRVTVSVTEVVSQVVTLEGEVQRPGVYPVIGKVTLMRAIARAEGTSDFANPRHVVIFRQVDGRQMAALYDLRAVRLGAYTDPQIYPNDLVVVGESTALKLFPQIAQISSVLLTPLITLVR